jgi:myo-inositol catabolism protein IolC
MPRGWDRPLYVQPFDHRGSCQTGLFAWKPSLSEDDRKVREWLGVAAKVPGFIGFAIGRTAFWDPLVDWHAGKAARDEAAARIASRYREFVNLFEEG